MIRIVASFVASFVASLIVAAPAAAQRPSTLAMTCSEAQALVAARDSIVLSTGRYTFDRFVSDDRFCYLGEYADPAFVQTADAESCRLFYICRPRPKPFEDLFERF